MSRIFIPVLLSVALYLPGVVAAQTLYNNGATLTIAAGATLRVVGNAVNAAGSTISAAGVLSTTGDITNNGTINGTVGDIVFNGSLVQTVAGSQPVVAGDVVMNNAAGVKLVTPLRVVGTMTFTDGIITADSASAPLVFTSTGFVSGTPTDRSHVDGYVQKLGTGAFTFPVGDTAKYQPVGVDLSSNASGITTRYYSGNAGAGTYSTNGSSSTPLLFVNRQEYWNITPASTAAGTVTINFDSYHNIGIMSTADLRVAHLSGGEWLNEGGTASGSPSSGSITSNSVSSWSPFTLGSISMSSPLPVKLLTFTGRVDGTVNRLEWLTAEEENGTSFVLERAGDDAVFSALGTVPGKGGNSGEYAFNDENPSSPLAYYRLRIVEPNGEVSYSQTVMLRRGNAQASQLSLYPNPATDKLTIATTSAAMHGTAARILDVQGREMLRFTVQPTQTLDVQSWAAGTYLLRLADGSTLKLVKH